MMVEVSELDNLAAAETAASMTIAHPDYAQVARIASQIYIEHHKSFSETMNEMFNYVNPRTENMHLHH
jgi:ribonucleoside-diphosphate reductase alpha chain